MQRPVLSLIIPIYNEEATIAELDRRLKDFLREMDETWEVVFVDDGSQDRTPEMLNEIAVAEPRYKVISFSRNFGHQAAITAGMDRAEGDAVVIMDADLQEPPEVVTEMIQKWREGYDVVYGQRSIRANPPPALGVAQHRRAPVTRKASRYSETRRPARAAWG